MNEWLSLWIKPSREAEEAASQWQVHASLPPITTDQVRDVARRFPLQTGLGWDNFHPRSLLLLSEALLERFVAILNRWERSPVMVDLWLTIMVFLPKPPPQLGRRPIGLLCMWGRVWSRIRQREVRRWEISVDEAFFWGKSGDTAADRAAYVHNLLVVHARRHGMVSGSVFFDLSRFYENVSHMAMKQAAVHYSFDLSLLRSLCALYRGPRRVRWMSATSRAIVPNGTVVAGCSCATGVVKLLTLCVLKAVAVETPVCRPINLVDDVKLHAVGAYELSQRN